MQVSEPSVQTINFVKEIEIAAPQAIAWESVMEELNGGLDGEDGKSMNHKLEAWPGGRWYRDLGNNTGHLWAHVQVIKPPKLLEIYGPMFMSFAAMSHASYRTSLRRARGASSCSPSVRMESSRRSMARVSKKVGAAPSNESAAEPKRRPSVK
jgi:hypothetical protein